MKNRLNGSRRLGTLARLLSYLKPYRSQVVLTLLSLLAAAGLDIVRPLLVRSVVDNVIVGGQSQRLVPLIGLILLVSLLYGGAMFCSTYLRRYLGERVVYDLRNQLYGHLHHLDAVFFHRVRTGELMSRAANDVQAVRHFMGYGLFNLARIAISFGFVLAAALSLSGSLTAILLLTGPGLYVTARSFRREIKPAFQAIHQQNANLSAALQENVTGVRVVRSFGQEAQEEQKFDRENRESFRRHLRAAEIRARYGPLMDFWGMFSRALLLLAGGWFVMEGRVSIGTFVALDGYLARLMQPIRELHHLMDHMSDAMASGERIFQLLDTAPSLTDPSEPHLPSADALLPEPSHAVSHRAAVEPGASRAAAEPGSSNSPGQDVPLAAAIPAMPAAVPGTAHGLPAGAARLRGEVRLEGVWLSYPAPAAFDMSSFDSRSDAGRSNTGFGGAGSAEDSGRGEGVDPRRWALRGVDLHVRAGETVAVVGPTGAGKTSLVRLLNRTYDPDRGRVLIDGWDVRTYPLAFLRRQVAFIPQEPFLFSATVYENIAYGRPDATQEEVEEAARKARAHDFIVALPQGYHTLVGERGAGLSGGQKQRITIARALLMKPAVLVIDDATSAVDTETEFLIWEALAEVMKTCTTFVVAQRLATLTRVDRIAVMDQGRIVEVGTHQELMQQGGLYARMVALQAAGGAEALKAQLALPSSGRVPWPPADGEGRLSGWESGFMGANRSGSIWANPSARGNRPEGNRRENEKGGWPWPGS